MRRLRVRSIALGLLLCLCCLLTLAESGALEGVVVGQRESDGGQELLLKVPAQAEGAPVTSVRVRLGRKVAAGSVAGSLPEGWTMQASKTWLVFSGPASGTELTFSARVGLPLPDAELQIEVENAAGKSVGGKLPVSSFTAVGEPADPSGVVQFPPVVSADGVVGFSAEDDELPPGTWEVGGADAQEGGDGRYTVDLDMNWTPGLGLGVKFADDWGKTYYDGALEDVEVVPAGDPQDPPRLTECSPKVLPGGLLCVCGYFPTLSSRESLDINGEPLGLPVTSSDWMLTFQLPGIAPGRFTVSGPEAAGYSPGSAVSGVHLTVGGELDQTKLRRGESTPLRLWINGSDEPMTLRVWNTTPEIVSLEGGEDQQITTSGGSPNQLERTVHAVTRGKFGIHYELAGDWCPCAETIAAEAIAAAGGAGLSSTTSSKAPCPERADDCEQLRKLAETTARKAGSARAEAERLEATRPWVEREEDLAYESRDNAQRYADTRRRQAADWRELADNSREMARECRRRDRELPGKGWDRWAKSYDDDAARRDRNAEQAEADAAQAEGQASKDLQRVEKLDEAIRQAWKAAQEAEQAAAKARAAFDACREWLKQDCPGEKTGTILYTGPVAIADDGGLGSTVDPADPDARICGPDITDLVLEVLDRMIDDYDRADATSRKAACRNLNNIERDESGTMIAEYAWDIFALSPSHAPQPSESAEVREKKKYWFEGISNICARPRDPCGPTVVFLGQCIHAQVVNYIQWGLTNKLCDTETMGGMTHWARATVGGLRSSEGKDFSDWRFKSAHYQTQLRMSELGSAYADLRRAQDADAGTAAQRRAESADALARQLAEKIRGDENWASRAAGGCAMICRLDDEESARLRDMFLLDGARPYNWYGLAGQKAEEKGIIPRR